MAVRMPHVHFPNVPRHVGRRPRNFESRCHALSVNGIDVVDPNGDPHAFLGLLVAIRAERQCEVALAATALTVRAEENLTFARADSSEVWRRPPIPCFLPTELLKPGEALLHI